MPSFSTTKSLPYSAKFIFDTIIDIESYPDFVPWCLDAHIIENQGNQMKAKLIISTKGVTEAFTSHITTTQNDCEYDIAISSPEDGALKFLKNTWHIKEIKDNLSTVAFEIDFKLKSKFFDNIVNMFFSQAADKVIKAFEQRLAKLSISK